MIENALSIMVDSVTGATSVFVTGLGILGMNMTNIGYFDQYETTANKDFVLFSENKYAFVKNENGSISCDKSTMSKKQKESLKIKKDEVYKIVDVSYSGEIKNNSNNLLEVVTIQKENNELIKFKLDSNDYGLSIKQRIDLLELCY